MLTKLFSTILYNEKVRITGVILLSSVADLDPVRSGLFGSPGSGFFTTNKIE